MRLRESRYFLCCVLGTLAFAQVRAAGEPAPSTPPTPKIHFRPERLDGEVRLRDFEAALGTSPRLTVAKVKPPTPAQASLRLDIAPTRPVPKVTVATSLKNSPIPALPPIEPPRLSAAPARGKLPPASEELALQPTTFTPYDRYLGTVRSVITNLEAREPTLATVARIMKEGRNFNYVTCDPYRANAPDVTDARRAGDCKSKALWLYHALGDADALYVIGKSEQRLTTSHAWVYWRCDDQWWILDCTDRSEPVALASVAPNQYIPYYSFGKAGAFRHRMTRLMPTGESVLPAVAMRIER